jgi:hypothetical protein
MTMGVEGLGNTVVRERGNTQNNGKISAHAFNHTCIKCTPSEYILLTNVIDCKPRLDSNRPPSAAAAAPVRLGSPF